MNVTDRNALVEKHWAIAKREAKRASLRMPIEYADLLGEAALGMLDAGDRYDPTKGEFTTFATWRMRGAMTDYARSQDGIGRMRRNELDAFNGIRDELANELLREPSTAEVYARLDVSRKQQRRMERALVQDDLVSLDAPSADAADDRLLHACAPGSTRSPEEVVVEHERRSTLLDAIGKLPHKQRTVVVMGDLDRIGLKVIAVCMGLSESRVSQLRKMAHANLRRLLTGTALDPAA